MHFDMLKRTNWPKEAEQLFMAAQKKSTREYKFRKANQELEKSQRSKSAYKFKTK
jgi:hypothetical protein